MDWKFYGNKPVYLQLMSKVRSAILTGEYPPGSRFPSVREIAAIAGVNPNTVQKAMSNLEQEGILVCGSTAGRFITRDEAVLAHAREVELQDVVQSCAAKFRALGLTPQEGAALLMQWKEKEEA